jgi:hypothetical protein
VALFTRSHSHLCSLVRLARQSWDLEGQGQKDRCNYRTCFTEGNREELAPGRAPHPGTEQETTHRRVSLSAL